MDNTNQAAGTGAVDNNATATDNDAEMVTMSKVDYDKAIQKAVQSAQDTIRTEYSKKLKAVEDKLPKEKTQAEKDYDTRLAELEAKQAEIDAKDKAVALKDALHTAGFDAGFANYLKSDVDVKAFSEMVTSIVNKATVKAGFVPPGGHASNTGITDEQFGQLKYSGMVKLQQTNPELVNQFMGK